MHKWFSLAQYYTDCCVLALTACCVFLRVNFVLKATLMGCAIVVYNLVFHLLRSATYSNFDVMLVASAKNG